MNERSGKKPKQVLPPVSTATGGLMPGIDLDDSASLQEMDDLAHLSRTRRSGSKDNRPVRREP
jgi:hypothetical protein